MLAQCTSEQNKVGFGLLGAVAVPVATGEDTGGAWEAMELGLSAEARSPLHTLSEDKLFYVVDGTVTIRLGDDEHGVEAGGFVHVPAGTAHCYRNAGGAPARMLVVTSGTGHVAFLRGMGALTAEGRPDPERLAAHTAAYGVHIMAPAS